MLLAEFDTEGGSSFHPLDATEMAGLSKYDSLDVSSIPTTRGNVIDSGLQVGFGDATDAIESGSTSSFASTYDSSEEYNPYVAASSNSGDVISSDTDTFWKGTFAGEVLDLSDYTDKTTGADYSFSSDYIEIGVDGDYFTVTDMNAPSQPAYVPTQEDLEGLVYTDNRWLSEAVISPDASDPSNVDNAYDDVQVYFQYQDDGSKRYAIDYDGDGVPEIDINYGQSSVTVDHPGQMNSSNVYISLWDQENYSNLNISFNGSSSSTQIELQGKLYELDAGSSSEIAEQLYNKLAADGINWGADDVLEGNTIQLSSGTASVLFDEYVQPDAFGWGFNFSGDPANMYPDPSSAPDYPVDIVFDKPTLRVEDIQDLNWTQPYPFMPTKHDNIDGADGVIGAPEGMEYDVWHLEDTSGNFTYYIRTDSSDPTTQVEIFDVNGDAFTESTLPHAIEDLYDANLSQLYPTVWENHSIVDGVQVYQTSDSLGQEMLAIDNADGVKTQVFDPEGTALVISNTIARKEDIFVDDSGQTQYYPFEYQDVSALTDDGFDGVDSLEYRESGFQTNQNYFVDAEQALTRILHSQEIPVYKLSAQDLVSLPNVEGIEGGAARSADGSFYASFKVNTAGSIAENPIQMLSPNMMQILVLRIGGKLVWLTKTTIPLQLQVLIV
jgi:hypothetical protein